jgi:hypothetical protein
VKRDIRRLKALLLYNPSSTILIRPIITLKSRIQFKPLAAWVFPSCGFYQERPLSWILRLSLFDTKKQVTSKPFRACPNSQIEIIKNLDFDVTCLNQERLCQYANRLRQLCILTPVSSKSKRIKTGGQRCKHWSLRKALHF